MDESGDLGFNMTKSRTSKFFVITFLVTKDEKIPNLIIKKFFQWLKHFLIKKKKHPNKWCLVNINQQKV
ncbi:DUF3800 domain-containing protein [bacterium]|nr:DUF3800 domain-containing protein [bacterium]